MALPSEALALRVDVVPIPIGLQQGGRQAVPGKPRSSGLAAASHRRRAPVVCAAAKKGGKGGGGGQKKGAGSPASPPKPAAPYLAAPVVMQNLLLIESYFRKTGRQLFAGEIEISEAAKALWEAPFATLAHDASQPEPLFVYANKAALELFECEWAELVGTPSSRSAEQAAEAQADRAAALSSALDKGYVDGYEGWRVSLKGTRFKISGATLFNVDAPSGDRVGQAAVIRSWEYEDGRRGGEGAAGDSSADSTAAALAPGEQAPGEEEVAAAAAAAAAQGEAVRALKEGGLGNGSAEVQAAVEELLRRKARLEALQRKAAAAAADAATAAGGAEPRV